MQKVLNIQRLSFTRHKFLPCMNVFLHSTQNLENSAADLKNKQQAEFDQHVADLVKKFGGSPKNNNENRQGISLSVLRHNINEDTRESKKLGFEIEKFDLIIDVRSPDEFKKDHIPNSVNMPVLSDEERQKVGTVYSSDQTSARGNVFFKKTHQIEYHSGPENLNKSRPKNL